MVKWLFILLISFGLKAQDSLLIYDSATKATLDGIYSWDSAYLKSQYQGLDDKIRISNGMYILPSILLTSPYYQSFFDSLNQPISQPVTHGIGKNIHISIQQTNWGDSIQAIPVNLDTLLPYNINGKSNGQ